MKAKLDSNEQEIENNAEFFVPVSSSEKEHIEALLQATAESRVKSPNLMRKKSYA